MTKEKAIKMAQAEARKDKTELVVVNAPVENAEDESGPFGYCATMAKDTLFPNATVIVTVSRHGCIMGMD
jgi:hypothetical protein